MKSGTERTKQRKNRESVFSPPPGGATDTVEGTTFKFGNIDLEQVEDYIYFRICFNWNGSFDKVKKLLHDKASKAMYSLIQKGRRLNLPTEIRKKAGHFKWKARKRYGAKKAGTPESGNVDTYAFVLLASLWYVS